MTGNNTFPTHYKACLCLRFLQASKNLDKLAKSKGEQEKRKKNVQKMQSDAISDNEEDEEAAEQMAANAQRQAQTLQAEDGDQSRKCCSKCCFHIRYRAIPILSTPHVQCHASVVFTANPEPCTDCFTSNN